MKKLLFLAVAFIAAHVSKAQSADTYIFKVENGKAYTPLTTGTNITAGLIWDEENFKIPLGFTADIGGKSSTYFSLMTTGVFAIASDTIGTLNVFIPFGADVVDRSLTSTPASPIRYLVSGTTPNRIFKLEFSNAGFFDEFDIYGTNDDSVDFQVWVYETSNIVEFRYGSSKITHPSDYFDGAAPIIGYAKNIDLDLGTFTKIYALTGNSSAPTVDSLTTIVTTPPLMSDFPASGTVYRFVPKSVAASIGEIDITANINVFPTLACSYVNVEYKSAIPAKAEIMNVSGQLVATATDLVKGSNPVNVTTLPSGQYLMRISNAEGNATYKFVKQ